MNLGRTARILLFDLENFPMRGYFWEMYDKKGHGTSIVWKDRDTVICSFVAKWLGEDKLIARYLPDYKGYKAGKENDIALVKEIWELFNEADVIVAQNGDNFDIKMMNTQFIKRGLPPPSPYKTVDTLKTAWKMFRFPSNKLDDLGDFLDEGRKVQTGGKDLWKQCMAGDMKSWRLMKEYNKQDVLLLERIYIRFLPWIKSHPNVATGFGPGVCPSCGSSHVTKHKFRRNATTAYQQYQCQDCGRYMRDHDNLIKKEDKNFVAV